MSAKNRLVTLVNVTHGGREPETELHQRFAHLRCNGEWFEINEEVRQFLYSILDERVDSRPFGGLL
jgi:hypothetical protein